MTCQLSAIIATPTTTTEMALETVLGQRGGEGPLGPDHVVVEPRDERAGLGAGEEGQRLPLHVGEHLGAQVVDQALADARGQPAARSRPGPPRTPRSPPSAAASSTTSETSFARMPSSTMRCTSSGRDDHEAGVDDGERQEDRDQAAVRAARSPAPAGPCPGRLRLARPCGRCACGATPDPSRSCLTNARPRSLLAQRRQQGPLFRGAPTALPEPVAQAARCGSGRRAPSASGARRRGPGQQRQERA